MAQSLVVVTGARDVDRKLAAFEPKVQRKLVRKALRKGGKRVLDAFRGIVRSEAYKTGTYMRAGRVRAMKRSRQRIGVTIHVDRDKYFEAYQSAYGKKPTPAKGESDPFYVPAAIEFGTDRKPGVRAQRRALYDNQKKVLSDFISDMRELIREARQ